MHASLCSTYLHSLSRGLLTPLSGGAAFSHQVIDLQLRLEAGLIRRPFIPREVRQLQAGERVRQRRQLELIPPGAVCEHKHAQCAEPCQGAGRPRSSPASLSRSITTSMPWSSARVAADACSRWELQGTRQTIRISSVRNAQQGRCFVKAVT